MNDYYCEICDKTIKLKSKTIQIGSEGHSHLNYYVRRKHSLGDIYWKNFEEIVRYYVNFNIFNIPFFKTLMECKLYGENIKFNSVEKEKRVRMYGFGDEGNFYYRFCVSKTIRDFVYHRSMLIGNELFPESIIRNLSLTFYSLYCFMNPKYRLQQPRRVLETRLPKHISKMIDFEKSNNYSFLSCIYNLVDHHKVDNNDE